MSLGIKSSAAEGAPWFSVLGRRLLVGGPGLLVWTSSRLHRGEIILWLDSSATKRRDLGLADILPTATGTPRAVPCPDLVDPCRAKYFRAVPS